MTESRASIGVDGRQLQVSNLDKVLFPAVGITKGQLIEHYERCGPLLLRHAGGRPLTLLRFPDGIDGEGWFQKHAPAHLPDWITRVALPTSERGRSVEHVVADSVATLVYLANLAAIELHVGPAPAQAPDRPEELILDLDPPPGADPRVVRAATRRCHDLLRELAIDGRLKTSGSAGFHVHVALRYSVTQLQTRDFARGLATVLASRHPDELTVEHRIDRRRGRVFVDWLRNAPRQTFVAPYSVRARPNAPVAAPMAWDELTGTDPQRWSIPALRRRLAQREDPWDAEPRRVSLREAASRLGAAASEVAHRTANTR